MTLYRAVVFVALGLGKEIRPGDKSIRICACIVVAALMLGEGRAGVFEVGIDLVLEIKR